jgi:CheY-like chemotaxis protein
VTALRDGGDVVIRVTDTGEGIPAELLPVIFNLFTQLDRTSGNAQGGLGIGLALVRRLVEMHGGTVTALSEGAGQGSEFVIRLPLYTGPTAAPQSQPDASTTASAQATASANAGGTWDVPAARNGELRLVKHRILIADDNSDALESLATLLQLRGHEVFTACDGAMALESAERNRPDVVLLDIGMPALDGCEVARRIRQQPWGSRIKLVALTGWGQDSDRRRSRDAGFDSHLVKPLDTDKLQDLLG